jgi:hypothetical protein
MNKLTSTLLAAALTMGSVSALAHDAMMMNMKAMDKDGDGMISKTEFMGYHEMMFDKMKKNSQGMVDMKDMQMMKKHMMNDTNMMEDTKTHE